MISLRVSIALAVSMMLAACGTTGTRPAPVPVPPPVATPAAADVVAIGVFAEPVAPIAAPAGEPAPVAPPAPVEPHVAAPPPEQAPKTSKRIPTPRAKPAKLPKTPKTQAAQAAPSAVAATKDTAAATSSLRGRVELDVATGQTVAPDEISDAVLYFLPDAGSRHAKAGNYLIYTHNKQFDPSLLVVPVGSTVKFPNQDEILHNVYSTTPGSTFDLGIYGNGGAGEYTFRKPGLVLIHCNVHEGMQADVLVLGTPYIARPAADGSFDLTGLPSGPGKLMLWHPRAARPVPLPISMPTADHPTVRIAITRPRAPAHHDKNGNAYRAVQP